MKTIAHMITIKDHQNKVWERQRMTMHIYLCSVRCECGGSCSENESLDWECNDRPNCLVLEMIHQACSRAFPPHFPSPADPSTIHTTIAEQGNTCLYAGYRNTYRFDNIYIKMHTYLISRKLIHIATMDTHRIVVMETKQCHDHWFPP